MDCEIKLTRGMVALVDESNFEKVSTFKWIAQRSGNKFYVARRTSRKDGHKMILLHRYLMGVLKDKSILIDHKNGNTLDNRISNLRKCTCSQNLANSKIKSSNNIGIKGVGKTGNKKMPFRARICVLGKRLNLGVFSDKISAGKAYEIASKKYFKEFSRTN